MNELKICIKQYFKIILEFLHVYIETLSFIYKNRNPNKLEL